MVIKRLRSSNIEWKCYSADSGSGSSIPDSNEALKDTHRQSREQ